MVWRVFGWILLALGFLALGGDALFWLQGQWHLATLGEFWFRLDPAGINMAQVLVQRYVWAALWDHGILPVLLLPAGPLLLGSGLVFAVLFRRRPPRNRPRFGALA